MDEAEDALRAITAGEIDAFMVSDGESGQRVFSLTRDAFFTLDLGWRYTYLNDQALALTERTRDEVLGRTIWEVSPALVGSPVEEVYRRVTRERVMVEFEEHDVPRDQWVSIRVYPTPDGIAVYVQDSTERKQLEAQLRRRRRWRRSAGWRAASPTTSTTC